MSQKGGEVYFALAMDWQLRPGLQSIPRRPLLTRFRPFATSPPAICNVRLNVAAELETQGHLNERGKRYAATAISRMLAS
jgi:hypothetical protein